MASAKGKLVRLLGGALLRRARVAAVEERGGFRRVVLHGDVGAAGPGTKVQLLLPSDDMRTYTPIPAPNGLALLGWRHASGPGARWIAEVEPGAEVRFVGPQRSLELAPGPVILVGDETSVAVGASFEAERPGQVTTVFAARDTEDLRAAAEREGLRPEAVVSRDHTEALVEAVAAARAAAPQAHVALTGGSELIVALRAALRQRGISDVKAKTYWVPGKRGLD